MSSLVLPFVADPGIMCVSAGPCRADLVFPASPSNSVGSPGSPRSPASPWTMGEMATPRSPLQSDSEGSTSSLELGSAVANIALTTQSQTPNSQEAVRCRWTTCGVWLGNLDALALHVTLAHASAGRGGLFYCGWEGCPRGHRGFNARYKMLVHVRTHTNERPHRCTRCEKSFSRAENLKIHSRSHTGERPYTCPVLGCNKAYSNSSDRFKHTRTHAVDKPYACKVQGCPKRYTDPSSLRKHVKTYRHFPHDVVGVNSPSPRASERDSSSPHSTHSTHSAHSRSPQPSSDEEARSAFRAVAPLVSPLALERPPLPGESTRGIPIKKAISARLRAVHGARHHDLVPGGGSSSGRAWAGGSVWVGRYGSGSGSTSPEPQSPSSSPSPSPSGTVPDGFGKRSVSPSVYSQSPPWVWNSVMSLWFPPTASTNAAHPTPRLVPAFRAKSQVADGTGQETPAPLDLTMTVGRIE